MALNWIEAFACFCHQNRFQEKWNHDSVKFLSHAVVVIFMNRLSDFPWNTPVVFHMVDSSCYLDMLDKLQKHLCGVIDHRVGSLLKCFISASQ